jgi:exopolysaccharide biosynthesis predicted pyruvyltransferase EpsI
MKKVDMTNSAASTYIADMQERIHGILAPLVPEGRFAILDFPDIKNVGDSAIWVGEYAYFRNFLNRTPAYTCTLDNLSRRGMDQAIGDGPIFLHGGGNFGDIWKGHQNFREHVLQNWRDRLVIQLPQSLQFNSPERLEQAKRLVDAHRNFVLLVRDEYSLELAQKNFNCRSILCPDMAFAIGSIPAVGEPIFPILAMLRKDKEQTDANDAGVAEGIPVEDWITEDKRPVQMAALCGILKGLPTLDRHRVRVSKYQAKALQRVQRGVRQLSRARTVITDRLHVHIISILLGKEHAVLDNSYGKIGRFRAAFPEPPGLTYAATSYEDAEAWAKQRS